MKVLSDVSSLKNTPTPMCIAAGFFDGVHKGHHRVLQRTLERARSLRAEAWALTFDRHPLSVVCPADAPRLITGTQHKLRLLEQLGIAGCLLLTFDNKTAEQTPEDFVGFLCRHITGLKEILVGENWRFGKGGAGNPSVLAGLAAGWNVSTVAVEPLLWKGKIISSTRIRESIQAGDLDAAAEMLGRRFGIVAVVVRGKGIGRKLGFPTANLETENSLSPPPGVYAVQAAIANERLYGLLYTGTRPTFEGSKADKPVLELHLPGIDRNLYGETIGIEYIRKLRDEREFDSPTALKSQIEHDIRQAQTSIENS